MLADISRLNQLPLHLFTATICSLRLDLLRLMLRPLHHLSLLGHFGRATPLRHLRFTLGLQAGRILGQLLCIRQELRVTGDILAQHLGHDDPVFGLVVFEDAAEGALGGAEGRVEGVDVRFLERGVGLFLLAVSVTISLVKCQGQGMERKAHRISSSRVW